MGRVREAEMPERIRNEKMTELVVSVRGGRGMPGKHREPNDNGERRKGENAPAFV
jgi:hypothetical protein